MSETLEKRLELVGFIESKIDRAEQELRSREEMQTTWRGGTDASWRAVGCRKSKAERLEYSKVHQRIANRQRRELEMFKSVLKLLTTPS